MESGCSKKPLFVPAHPGALARTFPGQGRSEVQKQFLPKAKSREQSLVKRAFPGYRFRSNRWVGQGEINSHGRAVSPGKRTSWRAQGGPGEKDFFNILFDSLTVGAGC